MTRTNTTAFPLVSVVIPCYNHAQYLGTAIQSAAEQDYPCKEIIVVDDGSSDHTAEVARRFPEVKYLHQSNAGLAAARNAGIDQSRGAYLIFLDADDVLVPGAIRCQAMLMQEHPQFAFISGGHFTSDEKLEARKEVSSEVSGQYYENLLRRNYIGMHAAVIYRREVLDELRFDAGLKACEDYDLYLRIAAKFPVHNHREPIAVYRGHSENMSANVTLMLESALQVLDGQKPALRNAEQQAAWRFGIRNWIDYYSYHSYGRLKRRRPGRQHRADLKLLWHYKRKLYIRHYLRKLWMLSKTS